MDFIVVVVLALLVLVVVIAVKGKGKRDAQQEAAPKVKRKDPLADLGGFGGDAQFFSINIGDLIKHDEKDFFVRRSVTSTEAGYTWHEFLLDDGVGTRRWLSVEDDDGLDLGIWEKLPIADITSGQPGDPSVVTARKAFKLKEQGSASYSADEGTEDPRSGALDYLQYEAADGTMLSFQRYDGGPWDASLGHRKSPSEFDIFPATQS